MVFDWRAGTDRPVVGLAWSGRHSRFEEGSMKLGLHIPDFTWPGGPPALAGRLAEVAVLAEQAGFDRVSVMDHLWQIEHIGPPEHEMLEAYTALGYLAARTERVKLLTVVTAVVYREPGLLAKAVTTLDVLSGGRAMLGIGAAWNEDEARGLGLFFPSTAERFERLEEALQICLQMWSDEDGPYEGKHYQLARTLNSPQSLTRPHPPILIGGAGERKTLRLVARYADACNIFDSPDLEHKLQVLRDHCAREGRDYAEIEKTVQMRWDLGPDGENVEQTIQHLRELAGMGIQVGHGTLIGAGSLRALELMAERVIPAVADL
jgi:F420-dependent oxidoreductase-like protein